MPDDRYNKTIEADGIGKIGVTGTLDGFRQYLEQTEESDIDEVVQHGLITNDYAFILGLRLEKVRKDVEKSQRRKNAQHPGLPDHEYVPYVLFRYKGHSRWRSRGVNADGIFFLEYPIEWGVDLKSPKFALDDRIYDNPDSMLLETSFIRDFLDREVNSKELFERIRSEMSYHMDLPEWCHTMTALWIMGTYVFECFNTYPYLLLNTEPGSGKSRFLKVVSEIAHNGVFVTKPTPASIFRAIHGRPTLCLDEMQLHKQDLENGMEDLLNSGYEKGTTTTRYNNDRKRVDTFPLFCPKVIAGTKVVSNILASRCIRIPIIRTGEKLKYGPREPYKRKDEFKRLQEDLAIWSVDIGPDIASVDAQRVHSRYEDVLSKVPPRLIQLLTPILVLFDQLGLDGDLSDHIDEMLAYQSVESEECSLDNRHQNILIATLNASRVEGNLTAKIIQDYLVSSGLISDEERRYYSPKSIGVFLKDKLSKKKMEFGNVYEPDLSKSERTEKILGLMDRYNVKSGESWRVWRDGWRVDSDSPRVLDGESGESGELLGEVRGEGLSMNGLPGVEKFILKQLGQFSNEIKRGILVDAVTKSTNYEFVEVEGAIMSLVRKGLLRLKDDVIRRTPVLA